jgi:hypothetical protein
VIYLVKARIVESQQVAVTRQWPVNNNRGMVFSVEPMLMAVHTIVEYIMPSLSNNFTATQERCFLRGLCQVVISRSRSAHIVTKVIVDYSEMKSYLEKNNLHYFTFSPNSKSLSRQ